jgi:hypothetical protein
LVRRRLLDIAATTHEGEQLAIVVGDATGVDSVARKLAREKEWTLCVFVANWRKDGKKAGPIRNQKMIETNPDQVVAFPRGASPGTRDTIRRAKSRGIVLDIIELDS